MDMEWLAIETILFVAWYNGHGMVSDRDYIIRGGLDKGLFYFGDISMNMTENSTRIVVLDK